MTTTSRGARRARRFALERRLAPHVDERWAEDLVVELRLLGVPGPLIGEALLEVESHCADSGEGAPEAFGDAVGYARRLGLPADDAPAPALVAAVWPQVLAVLGMLGVLVGFPAWREAQPLELTAGMLGSVLLLLAALGLLVRAPDLALRAAVHRPVVTTALLAAFLATTVLLQVALGQVVARVPAVLALAVGGLALLAGVGVQLLRWARRTDEDPVTSPLAGAGGPDLAAHRGASLLVVLSVPVATLVLLAVTASLAP